MKKTTLFPSTQPPYLPYCDGERLRHAAEGLKDRERSEGVLRGPGDPETRQRLLPRRRHNLPGD